VLEVFGEEAFFLKLVFKKVLKVKNEASALIANKNAWTCVIIPDPVPERGTVDRKEFR